MDTFDAIYGRRAVKHYDPEHELSDDEISKLLEAAIQSPTSFSIQNWRFVLVRDKALRQQIRAAANDQAQITDASLLIVMTADLKAWEKSPETYWRDAPPEVAEILVNWMGPFYQGKEELQRDEAMRSCGLAGQTIMLAAKAIREIEKERIPNLRKQAGDIRSRLKEALKSLSADWKEEGE